MENEYWWKRERFAHYYIINDANLLDVLGGTIIGYALVHDAKWQMTLPNIIIENHGRLYCLGTELGIYEVKQKHESYSSS